ncbi:MAG: glycosylase [Verrucomicrobia bacterium]|nr:glycosylase [Verrucomicrobiota bacterium]
MFTWQKLGRVFDPGEVKNRPWLKEFAQAPAVLLYDDFVRVYFSGRPGPDTNGQYVSYTGFVDLNRDNLFQIEHISEEPILPLGGLGHFDEFGIYPASVIRRQEAVYVYYGGWTRCESVPFNVAIGLGISHDGGVTFEKAGQGPVLSYSPDEPFVLSGPKIRQFAGRWYLWYIAGRKWIMADGRPEPVYRIRMAVSEDGYSWRKMNRDLIDTRIEEDEAQASPDVFFANGVYHMFFCYRNSTDFRGKPGGYRIGYARSKNLVDWVRDDSKAGIDVSITGWDSEMVAYPHVFELDGQIYMMYLGNQVGRHGFGLARMEGELT